MINAQKNIIHVALLYIFGFSLPADNNTNNIIEDCERLSRIVYEQQINKTIRNDETKTKQINEKLEVKVIFIGTYFCLSWPPKENVGKRL